MALEETAIFCAKSVEFALHLLCQVLFDFLGSECLVPAMWDRLINQAPSIDVRQHFTKHLAYTLFCASKGSDFQTVRCAAAPCLP